MSVALVSLTACSTPSSNPTPIATIPRPDVSASVGSTVPARLDIQDRAGAAVIDICIDTGPETRFIQGTQPARMLAALADRIAEVDLAEPSESRGLVVRAWVMAGPLEPVGPVIDTEVPDILPIEIPVGVTGQQLFDVQIEQANQRARVDGVREAQLDLETELRSVALPDAAVSDVLHCISRANAASADLDPARRLLIVASTFPLQDAVSEQVVGDLSTTRQVLLLTYGLDVDRRQEAWLPTWDSLGLVNRYIYPFEDALESPLRQAIAGILA